MPGQFDPTQLPTLLSSCLSQAQKTTSTHRKNIAILQQLFILSSSHVERLGNGKGTKLVGEKAFLDALKEHAVNRVLVVRKGVVQADRVVKFLAGFVSHVVESGGSHLLSSTLLESAVLNTRSNASLLHYHPHSFHPS